jgi:hypothetical protein
MTLTNIQMSDGGDFEPMEPFTHYHGLSPNPKEKTFLEAIADVDEDGDDDMMEYIQTQVSTHTVSYHEPVAAKLIIRP